MELEEGIKRIKGIVEVEIQGFFTERFINLCRINNIKIWNIKNVVNGIVRFSIAIKDFKKIKPIAKKTKCKVKIISKKGVYFKLFKYRKRSLAFILILLFLILSTLSTTFIWNIEVVGNMYIPTENIYSALKDNGLYVGRNKIGLKTKKIINAMRVELTDIAWMGIEIDGTHAKVKVVEKTKLPESAVNENAIGDIVSDKSGVIEKIVVENGTAILEAGDYVEEGRILIEGKIYSKFLEPKDVSAKGIVTVKRQYEYKKEYPYTVMEKEYNKKAKYSIGFTLNDKENYINYLDKSLKYDIIKNSKEISIFNNKLSLTLYRFNIYDEKSITRSDEQIEELARNEAQEYIEKTVLPDLRSPKITNKELIIDSKDEDKVCVRIVYDIVEEIGYFKERV